MILSKLELVIKLRGDMSHLFASFVVRTLQDVNYQHYLLLRIYS